MIDWRAWLTALRPQSASETPPEPRQWTFDPAPLPGTGDRLADAIRNGAAAQHLLENELLRWSLGEIRKRLRDQLESCPIRDTESMQVLRLWIECAKGFEENLQSLITDGKMASDALADMERQRELEKRYGRINI